MFVPDAVIVTELEVGIVAGALKRPVAEMVPAEAVQATVLWPDAVNCCVAPSPTCAVDGETVIGPPPVVPPVSVTIAVPF